MTQARISSSDGLAFEHRATRWNSPAGRAREGGDWCDIVDLGANILALTIGDVAGHGEPAAGTMHVLRGAIVAAVRESRSPPEILAMANRLAFTRGEGVIATAIIAYLDRERGTLIFANAGHPPPLLVTDDGHTFLTHSPGDLPLGIFPQHRAAEYVVVMSAETLVTFYTDGITEHRRDIIAGEGDLIGACRSAYGRAGGDDARAIAEHVLRDGRSNDDAAVMALRLVRAG